MLFVLESDGYDDQQTESKICPQSLSKKVVNSCTSEPKEYYGLQKTESPLASPKESCCQKSISTPSPKAFEDESIREDSDVLKFSPYPSKDRKNKLLSHFSPKPLLTKCGEKLTKHSDLFLPHLQPFSFLHPTQISALANAIKTNGSYYIDSLLNQNRCTDSGCDKVGLFRNYPYLPNPFSMAPPFSCLLGNPQSTPATDINHFTAANTFSLHNHPLLNNLRDARIARESHWVKHAPLGNRLQELPPLSMDSHGYAMHGPSNIKNSRFYPYSFPNFPFNSSFSHKVKEDQFLAARQRTSSTSLSPTSSPLSYKRESSFGEPKLVSPNISADNSAVQELKNMVSELDRK